MNLAAFIQQTGSLPSLSTIHFELRQAIDNAYTSIEEIGDIIRKDQGLATRLLKLANSAMYGMPKKVQTLEDALNMIGLRQLSEMALATTIISSFQGIGNGLVDVPLFWRHNIACAVGSAVIAQERREPVPERFFLGGLLHDIGRLVMYIKAPRESAQILDRCRKTGELSTAVETEVLGFDHAAIGAAFLESWDLPRPLLEMVRCHHLPGRSNSAQNDAAIVHVADFIANMLGWGSSGEYAVAPLIEDGWKRTQLDDEGIEAIVEMIEARYEPLCDVLLSAETNASDDF